MGPDALCSIMKQRAVGAVLVCVVAVSLLGGAAIGGGHGNGDEPAGVTDENRPPSERLVHPRDEASSLWPYTSRARSVEGRTLPLNVVVFGAPDRVRTVLESRSSTAWSSARHDGAVGETPWRAASGATRYTYVAGTPNGSGQWVDASYQLAVGSYFTSRVHVRAYPAPSGDWTALQAHTEYWDWFRLRHTVTGTATGARFVEEDLRGLTVTGDLRREYHGLGGSGNSGWLTVVELGTAAAGMLLVVSRRRLRPTHVELVLPITLVALVIGVRAGGIATADLLSGMNPQYVAGAWYPLLVAGPPLVTAKLAPGDARYAAGLSALGLGVGVSLDLALVGVARVPIRMALHRVALVGSLSLVAVGASASNRRLLAAGVAAWVVTLGLPLAGVV